jgi:hypothetical protein
VHGKKQVDDVAQPEFYLDERDTTIDSLKFSGSPITTTGAAWRGQLDEITGTVIINRLADRNGGIDLLRPDNSSSRLLPGVGFQDACSPGRSIVPDHSIPPGEFTCTPAGRPQIDPADPHRFVMDGKEWYPVGGYMPLGYMTNRTLARRDDLNCHDPAHGIKHDCGTGVPLEETARMFHNKLAAHGLNLYRAVFSMGQSVSGANCEFFEPGQESVPYNRSGTPGAPDGGNKFDLTSFNQAHFDYWKYVLEDARIRGIVVQLCILVSPKSMDSTKAKVPEPWGLKFNFYAADMNINGCAATTFNNWHATSGPVWNAQKALLDKVVQELSGYPNLIWEIANEPRPYYDGNDFYGPPPSNPNANDWTMQLAAYLKTKDSSHICMPVDMPDHQHVAGQKPDLRMTRPVETDSHTPAGTHRDMVRQFNLDRGFAYWPTAAQPLIADNDAPGSDLTPADRRRKVWACLTAGGYMSYFHSLFTPSWGSLLPFSLDQDEGLSYLGRARKFHQDLKVQLRGTVPADNLVSNGWCVARSGEEYVVYLISGGSTTVSNLPPTCEVARWFNPRTGESQAATASGSTFTSPTSGPNDDWVLYISRSAPQ